MNPQQICVGCMEEHGGAARCPYCGWEEGQRPTSALHLPPRTMLANQFLVGRVLGHGGFGILYLAMDMRLERKVAVKEYMPQGIAGRSSGTSTVSVFTNPEDYRWGLGRFLDEARTVARFAGRPDIVSVIQFFEENETGYMVMEYLEGGTLEEYADSQGRSIPYDTAVRIMMPVLDVLREVHRHGILHRDISPDNIYLTNSGLVKVLDFGAARQALGQKSRNLSVILKEGYAPEEQYRTKGHQGPWTDIYATAATLYRVLTGQAPPPASDRTYQDEIRPPSSLGVWMPPGAELALMRALAVRAEHRFQTVDEFQAALRIQPAEPPPPAPYPVPAPGPATTLPPYGPPRNKTTIWLGVAGAAAVLILLVVFLVVRSNEQALIEARRLRKEAVGLYTGTSGKVNNQQAAALFQQADELGDPLAHMWLARGYHNGILTLKKDAERGTAMANEAMPDVLEVSGAGDAEAAFLLGSAYSDGLGVARDDNKAVQLYERACGGDFLLACNNLGAAYDYAAGVQEDDAKAFKLFREACDDNLPHACVNLGSMHARGAGTRKDQGKASVLYGQACEKGYARGCDRLGWVYHNGTGVSKDDAKAAELFRQACEGGESAACGTLAWMYENGLGVSKDDSEADTLYERACDGGNSFGCRHKDPRQRAVSYYTGTIGYVDAKMAAALFQRADQQGDLLARMWLARSYHDGRLGLKRDREKGAAMATELMTRVRRMADSQNPEAEFLLGAAYSDAVGVERDHGKAAEYYEKACSEDFLLACSNLGLLYAGGSGVTKDPTRAVELLEKSCKGSDQHGCYHLGRQYLSGTGVAKNLSKAVELYTQSCDEGFGRGCDGLAWMYDTGTGVTKNSAKAVEYYRRSCDKGFWQGCADLGLMYYNGKGVTKNFAKAAEYWIPACDGGNPSGCNNLAVLYASGKHYAKDDARAAALYRQACAEGVAVACNNLGSLYEHGRSVPKNTNTAVDYFRRACKAGHEDGCKQMKRLCPSCEE